LSQTQDDLDDNQTARWNYLTTAWDPTLPITPQVVESCKLTMTVRRSNASFGESTTTISWSDEWEDINGGPFPTGALPPDLVFTFPSLSNETQTITQDVSPFLSVIPDPTTDKFSTREFFVENQGGTSGDIIDISLIELEIFYRIGKSLTQSIQTQTSQIEAAAGGTGLQFFAVCDGPEIPDEEGPGTTGELMSHPADVIFHWLRRVGGIPLADIDASSFDDTATNLGSGYVWGFDARNLGATWGEILLQMGYEARANVANLISSGWSMLTAQTTHDFPAAAVTVDSYGDLITIGKDDAELKSRLTVYFAHDPRFESSDNRSFQQVKTTDPTLQAVIDREEEFGRNDAEPYFLFCSTSQGATGVDDWKLYMEQELGRFARLFACRVDHWQSYPLELGDVVTFEIGAESVKTRVIEVTRSERQGFLLRFAEVL
jgi:hypothetical protein